MPIVTIPAAGQYGFIADQPAQELPSNAWSSSQNMRFRDGSAEKFLGHSLLFTAPSVTPYWVQPYSTTTTRYWIHAGLAAVYSDDGVTRTNITGTALTASANNRFTGGSLNGVFVVNSQADVPMFWGGTGTLATLTGWNANWRAKAIRPFKNFLVALHITKTGVTYPHMVKWSDAADPGAIPASWDETDPTKLSAEVDLAETPDWLVDCLPLGDANIIYKQRSMYAMRLIGGSSVFEFRRLPGNFGMLTQGCAAQTPKGHVVLCAGDVVLHNGDDPQSIISGRLRTWLFDTQIDQTYVSRCFVVANPSRSEVWLCYPEIGQSVCTAAIVWNWESDTWSPRQLPNVTHAAAGLLGYSMSDTWAADSASWDSDSTAWNQNDFTSPTAKLVMASTLPALYLADSSTMFANAGITSRIERTGITLDDPLGVKLIRSVTPRVDASAGTQITITVGSSMDAEVAPTWSAPFTYTVGTSYKANVFSNAGRFLAIRVEGSGGQRWRIKSFDLDVVKLGSY